MKILFIIDGLKGGGKERQLNEIINSLLQDSPVSIGVITFNKNQHYTTSIKSKVSCFVELNKHPNPFLPLFTIWRHIVKFNPDIIHTWDSLSSFYAYLPSRYLKIKFVDGSIRDAGFDKGWEKVFKKFFLKRADIVIANSKAGLAHYNTNGKVIYNAINLRRFNYHVNHKSFNIVMTANFTDYKDHKTFINAALELVAAGNVDHVYLIGDGPHKIKYVHWLDHEFTQIKDKFHFLGSISNVEEYLALCQVGILCSTPEYSEGLSNAVLEYMASGLIPIVTDLGGSSEIINHRVNGFLISPENKEEIVYYVNLIKSEEALTNDLKRNAAKTIREKFSPETIINQLNSIYKELLHV